MKKKTIMLLLVAALILSACGAKSEPAETNQPTTVEAEEKTSAETQEVQEDTTGAQDSGESGQIEVNEGLFDVQLTIPADFVGEQTQDDLDVLAKEYGFQSITLNEDGSATYIMTKEQHKELMEDYKAQINSGLQELVGSEAYPNFTKIEANDDFTEFTVTTKSAELDFNESFSVMNFYIYGGMYNAFSGEENKNISVTFINADSGEVIETANSSDME